MKNQLLVLLLFLSVALFGQHPDVLPTDIDTAHNKMWLVAEGGAYGYTGSPVIGIVLVKEVTDKNYPVTIYFRNGYLITPGARVPDQVFVMQCGLSYSPNKKLELGIYPWYFIAYMPKTDFRTPIALFTNININKRLACRFESSYFWGENRMGASATLNFKLLQLKNM